MISLERFTEIINSNFCEPFLEDGLVRARLREDGSMDLYIGRRDVHVGIGGEVRGAGTGLCCPVARELP